MQEIDPALTKRRSAFTLIEILIVIAIIAILASLLLGAVVAVRRRIPETTTRNDILQLSTAMNAFYAKYKFYPPNRLHLCSSRATYGNPAAGTLGAQSVAAITKMFPDIAWSTTPIRWDGVNNNVNVTLEGDQCLVFFLGGIPSPPPPGPWPHLPQTAQPPLGFSTNPADPSAATPAHPDRFKFMTTFDNSRLALFRPRADPTHSFPSYMDGYAVNLPNVATGVKQKQPYLYFSSMSAVFRENGYVSPLIVPAASGPPGANVSPYIQQAATATAPTNYWNSKSFQIISAGADGTFGPGGSVGAWPPAQLYGMDDMSNFNSSVLSAPD